MSACQPRPQRTPAVLPSALLGSCLWGRFLPRPPCPQEPRCTAQQEGRGSSHGGGTDGPCAEVRPRGSPPCRPCGSKTSVCANTVYIRLDFQKDSGQFSHFVQVKESCLPRQCQINETALCPQDPPWARLPRLPETGSGRGAPRGPLLPDISLLLQFQMRLQALRSPNSDCPGALGRSHSV